MVSNKKQKREIIWNITNSLLAGALVLLGSFTTGSISLSGIVTALVASLIVAITKFKEYWCTQEKEYQCNRAFNFL